MKFPIKDFSSKCDQIRRKQQIWPHLLKKFVMENFIFCAVRIPYQPYSKKIVPQTHFVPKNVRQICYNAMIMR